MFSFFFAREWLFSAIDMLTEAVGANSIAHRLIRGIAALTILKINLFRTPFVDTIVVESQKRIGRDKNGGGQPQDQLVFPTHAPSGYVALRCDLYEMTVRRSFRE